MSVLINIINEYQVLVGVSVTWIVYRAGVYSERKNIIESIKKELELHVQWVGTPYSSRDINNLTYQVIEVSTIAVENAIVKGPSIFLNKELIDALIGYNQSIYRFNQIIESSNDFRSNVELWDGQLPTVINTSVKDRMKELNEKVHTSGIGDTNTQGAAHMTFSQLKKEIEKEDETVLFLFIWLLFNLNLFWIKKYIIKLL